MIQAQNENSPSVIRDLTSGLVVFFVAIPLCLGIAMASGAPLFSGLLAGIIGGIVVGLLSGSQSSVSGPAAGLTAVVAAQIAALGSFQVFLLALCIAGLIQIGLGIARLGAMAAFFPSSVIKGLLSAIGVILILKQIPHLLGHDADPEGNMAFSQPDNQNTLSELINMFDHVHLGALSIGIISIVVLVLWERWKWLKRSPIPGPLVVVLLSVGLSWLCNRIGGRWLVESSQMVQVPIAGNLEAFVGFLTWPDFSQFSNSGVYTAAFTIAAVASLETLLNLDAIDKLDPDRRHSPPNRELLAQGAGNFVSGLIGGIPVTSVIVRSSVNIEAGGRTKLAAVFHGLLLLVSVALFPVWLNMIPLSCLAAILLITGFKLISPALVRQMWNDGRYRFVPFAVTVIAIVFTDLMVGVVIGLAVSTSFILNSNVRRPVRRFVERHLGGDVLLVQLGSQVSFLNRAALIGIFDSIPRGGKILLNATRTDFVDPDILDLIRDFKEQTGPARGVEVSLSGFRTKYQLKDQIQYIDYSTRDLQEKITPMQVLQIFRDGHERFRSGQRLTRDLGRQVEATAEAQHPFAVVLSCIDSRTPAELIFDLGVGDVFSVRVAGNVLSKDVIGSIEFSCAVADAKLILVMGHTRCGAVTAAVKMCCNPILANNATDSQNLNEIVAAIQLSIDPSRCASGSTPLEAEMAELVDDVSLRNVRRVTRQIRRESATLDRLVHEGKVVIVGAMYDVNNGAIQFLDDDFLDSAPKELGDPPQKCL